MPPLGSFKDQYLRSVMDREREIEWKTIALNLILGRGKTQEAAGDNRLAMTTFKEIMNLLFPNVPIANKEEDGKMLTAVDLWLRKNQGKRLLDDGGPQGARPDNIPRPTRRSLWDTMQEGTRERPE